MKYGLQLKEAKIRSRNANRHEIEQLNNFQKFIERGRRERKDGGGRQNSKFNVLNARQIHIDKDHVPALKVTQWHSLQSD